MSKSGKRLIKAAEEMVSIANGEKPAAAIWMDGHRYVPASALHRLANASLGMLEHWNSLDDNRWTVDGVTWRPEWPGRGLGDDLNTLHAAYHAIAPLIGANDIWAECPASISESEVSAAAKAMEAKRLELIAQPIARIYPQLAEAAIKAAIAVRKG